MSEWYCSRTQLGLCSGNVALSAVACCQGVCIAQTVCRRQVSIEGHSFKRFVRFS